MILHGFLRSTGHPKPVPGTPRAIMAQRNGNAGRTIAAYEHPDKDRVNNPPVGLVTPETDRDAADKTYAHDPHLDPQLSWSGKAEHASFEVPTVSLHVHERIDPHTIIEAVRNKRDTAAQGSLFATLEENPPLQQAIEDACRLVPRPEVVVFAAFQFDPEASKDIDETEWPGVTLLKAQMNADLLTGDLKKERASNESFWLVGQPDVALERVSGGKDEAKFVVKVQGFDYYNTKTGNVESGNADRIALWMLDPDYDGRSLFPRQVFFPMAGAEDGWSRLAKSLEAEIDATRMEAYRGTVSLPFEPGKHRRAAVKIVDDRGVESLEIVELQ